MQDTKKLKVLFVSAEVSPFAKVGGLADVAGSLPQALAAAGNDVRIAMPRYKSIEGNMGYIADFPVKMDWRNETCVVRKSDVDFNIDGKGKRLPVYFLDNYHYFYRDGIYCFHDDGERFAFFCNAVLGMLEAINFQPDIIHCNDWHTGPICMLLRELYKDDPFYGNISTVFTIHNLQYQGLFPKDILKLFNIGENVFTPDKTEFYGAFNFLKSGVVYADVVSTVSETYAREIQTPEYGEKLEGLLKSRSADLYGIVNGIDYNEFNPETDPRIYRNFGRDNHKDKIFNKRSLQREMNLPESDLPLIGLVTRLTGQKGLGLLIDAVDDLVRYGIQLVLLGSGDEYYETAFKNLSIKYPENIAVYVGFNIPLAQRIYSGCDMFLMPSYFEPCGLGQLISMRYGTVPIVRSTGGLAETVTDYDEDRENGNGFSFSDFSPEEMKKAVKRAIDVYNNKPREWEGLVLRALNQDSSWDNSAKKYMRLYEKAVKKVK